MLKTDERDEIRGHKNRISNKYIRKAGVIILKVSTASDGRIAATAIALGAIVIARVIVQLKLLLSC